MRKRRIEGLKRIKETLEEIQKTLSAMIYQLQLDKKKNESRG